MLLKVGAATISDLKARGIGAGFKRLRRDANVLKCDAKSGIPNQPFGREQIIKGLNNRLEGAAFYYPDADFLVAVESGIIREIELWYDIIGVAVRRQDQTIIAWSAAYPLPDWIVDRVREHNTEIGHIVQELEGGGEKDGYKYFARGQIRREDVIQQAVEFALMPFLEPDRFAVPAQYAK